MTRIEWCKNPDNIGQGSTWNPITGCLNHVNGLCKGGGFPCYAYKLAHRRLSSRYLADGIVADEGIDHENLSDPFYPRFWEERLSQPIGYATTKQVEGVLTAIPPKGKGIFVCDMSDLFGIGITEEWTRRVLDIIKHCPWHRFYLLTKQPQRLPKFSPFPGNCWVGFTATSSKMFVDGMDATYEVKAKVLYVSLEPLLEWYIEPAILYWDFKAHQLDWLIIGACTGSKAEMSELVWKYPDLTVMSYGTKWTAQPRIEWVREIVEAADKAGVKVFLKNNLKPLLVKEKDGNEYAPLWANGGFGTLRQEMPDARQ